MNKLLLIIKYAVCSTLFVITLCKVFHFHWTHKNNRRCCIPSYYVRIVQFTNTIGLDFVLFFTVIGSLVWYAALKYKKWLGELYIPDQTCDRYAILARLEEDKTRIIYALYAVNFFPSLRVCLDPLIYGYREAAIRTFVRDWLQNLSAKLKFHNSGTDAITMTRL